MPDIALKPGEEIPAFTSSEEMGEILESEAAPLAAEAEETVAEEKRSANTGPILGIQPAELQGQTIDDDIDINDVQEIPTEFLQVVPYRVIEYVLLAISLISAIAAIILRRRKRAA